MNLKISRWKEPLSIAPLISFRVVFGLAALVMTCRTMALGWIDKFYLQQDFGFKLLGFEWVQPLPPWGMYLLFTVMALSALCIILGAFYRIATLLFLLTFSYSELIDLTHYLNHHYLMALMAALLLFLPANRRYAVDVWRKPPIWSNQVPRVCIDIIRLQLGLVYFFAGVAKVQSDWLMHAQPLQIWLSQQSDLFLIGPLFQQRWLHYGFSWAGCLYDLFIFFFLINQSTRTYAYIAVVVFHLLTALLFNIGLFPWFMILLTTVMFSAAWHQRKQAWLWRTLQHRKDKKTLWEPAVYQYPKLLRNPLKGLLLLHLIVQVFLPLRHQLYPGNVLWTEEGFRFSWRVMLIEKRGYSQFYVADARKPNRKIPVQNLRYLTDKQEVMMNQQADFLLQFAHFLAAEYREKYDFESPIVTVDAFVALNGRLSQRYIRPTVNLAQQQNTIWPKPWILPLEEESGSLMKD